MCKGVKRYYVDYKLTNTQFALIKNLKINTNLTKIILR